jgi:HAD superfamily hydrolase (TIGR01549 family)
MKSKDWWSMLVKNMLVDDSKVKNLNLNEKFINQISDDIFNEFSKATYWKKYDNCDYILHELTKRNFKLGIISNFDERLFEIIKNLNIDSYFSFVCIPSNSNGSYKPRNQIFEIAREQAKLDKNTSIIHIGDDFELDYKAAINSDSNFKSILLLNEDHNKNKYNQLINNNNNYNKSNTKEKKDLVQIDKNDIVFNLKQLLELLLLLKY